MYTLLFKIILSSHPNFLQKSSTCSPLLIHDMLLCLLYCPRNLDIGQKIYQQDTVSIIHIVFSIYPLRFTQSDSNNTRTVVYTTQMLIINVINGAVCFNSTTTRIHSVRLHNRSYGLRRCSVGLVSTKPLRLTRMQVMTI